MQSMTIRLPDELMEWLRQRAQQAKRTKNRQVEYLLAQAWQQEIDREVKEEMERRGIKQ